MSQQPQVDYAAVTGNLKTVMGGYENALPKEAILMREFSFESGAKVGDEYQYGVELTRPRSVVGKNTVECMQAGAVFGFAGLVDGLVSRIREDIDGFGGDNVAVVATGHTAPLLLPDLHTVHDYDRHLTLDGLRLVFERNRDSQRGRLKQAR